jgi:hypothetical protein
MVSLPHYTVENVWTLNFIAGFISQLRTCKTYINEKWT